MSGMQKKGDRIWDYLGFLQTFRKKGNFVGIFVGTFGLKSQRYYIIKYKKRQKKLLTDLLVFLRAARG